MTEATFRELLEAALYSSDELGGEVEDTRSYSDAGLMTMNEGLVVRLLDGSEFQLQVVRSR